MPGPVTSRRSCCRAVTNLSAAAGGPPGVTGEAARRRGLRFASIQELEVHGPGLSRRASESESAAAGLVHNRTFWHHDRDCPRPAGQRCGQLEPRDSHCVVATAFKFKFKFKSALPPLRFSESGWTYAGEPSISRAIAEHQR